MLSLDLFNSRYEKKLHEGAVDDTIAHLIEPLSRRAMDIRTKLRTGRLDPKQVVQLEKEYEELVQKRLDIILDRKTQTQEQQVPSKQDPFAYVKPEPRGIGDIQDPRAKMAQLQQRAKKGALANVGAGLKAFIKGEPEPMDEEQVINPRALGVANFQRLLKANMGNIPTASLEFIRPEENFKLDQKGLELISDYYDGLENDQAKNYFIYRVLPSGDETRKILKQLGWNPQQVQPSLPGIPTQGELPLQEKKKFKDDDLEAGDVKVARELQKLRAQYPAAKSDVEAVARAEIDSTERSQQQLAAIRGANEKQDALLKQLVDLDQEQGREINTLDKENNSLEKNNSLWPIKSCVIWSENDELLTTAHFILVFVDIKTGKPVTPPQHILDIMNE
jgi:acyl-CoA thioester hydrolase